VKKINGYELLMWVSQKEVIDFILLLK